MTLQQSRIFIGSSSDRLQSAVMEVRHPGGHANFGPFVGAMQLQAAAKLLYVSVQAALKHHSKFSQTE